jgi:hypothetical protein
MLEGPFVTELQRGLDLCRSHFYKIPDAGQGRGAGLAGMGKGRFSVERPYDLYVVHKGTFHAIECKMRDRPTFPISTLPEDQELQLKEASVNGGEGWLAVCFHCRPSDLWRRKRTKAGRSAPELLDEAWAVPVGVFQRARDVDCWVSMDMEWWEKNGVLLPLMDYKGKRLRDPSGMLGCQSLSVLAPPPRRDRLWD